ncbi:MULTISPECIES: putative quinol monooxygenase [unclassified Enterococcus]|uniref:putative quinol monooxygenase n=1 Tax=unclassified Enterococcus TaxID=2608891 RepID=UPI0020CF1C4A|nr:MULTISPECIES: putative quinol monooxygenase [unclassified Enterococcus]
MINVFFDVLPECKEEFMTLLDDMIGKSTQEEGNRYYHLLEDLTQKNRYTLIEHWENQDAVNFHNKTSHWIHFDKTVNNFLNDTYEEHHYTEIPF